MNEKISQFTVPGKSAYGKWGMFLKWLIVILSYSFLAYKLFIFNQYDELASQWKNMPLSQLWWLLAVFLLLPVNVLCESLKWKVLVSKVQIIDFKLSLKAVLVGFSTGFFTPNRVGELVGRVMYLDAGNRKSGVTMSLVSSLTQSLVMTFCGVPACVLFFMVTKADSNVNIQLYLLLLIICFIAFLSFYFLLPMLVRLIRNSRIAHKIDSFIGCLADYSFGTLLKILLISLLRYTVFCLQFYLMLRFFGVDFPIAEAAIAIPTSYLFVTFTPSVAFSEAAVRSSYAVVFIGAFSPQIVSIALAGVCIWIVNFVIPMLVGSIVLIRK